jgi:hypothetical protein
MAEEDSAAAPLLFETLPVDDTLVAKVLLEHWDLILGDNIKRSQNHTYAATSPPPGASKFIVRVTPDPTNKRFASIQMELELLEYVCVHVCMRICGWHCAQDWHGVQPCCCWPRLGTNGHWQVLGSARTARVCLHPTRDTRSARALQRGCRSSG